jgi:hypothetical protein
MTAPHPSPLPTGERVGVRGVGFRSLESIWDLVLGALYFHFLNSSIRHSEWVWVVSLQP